MEQVTNLLPQDSAFINRLYIMAFAITVNVNGFKMLKYLNVIQRIDN